jgi:hypothetical protein
VTQAIKEIPRFQSFPDYLRESQSMARQQVPAQPTKAVFAPLPSPPADGVVVSISAEARRRLAAEQAARSWTGITWDWEM